MKIEVTIYTKDAVGRTEVEAMLILGLVRSGYAPYLTECGVAYTCNREETITEMDNE